MRDCKNLRRWYEDNWEGDQKVRVENNHHLSQVLEHLITVQQALKMRLDVLESCFKDLIRCKN